MRRTVRPLHHWGLPGIVVLAGLAACAPGGHAPRTTESAAPPAAPFQASPLYQDGAPWPGPASGSLTVRHAQVLRGTLPRFGGWSGVATARTAQGTVLTAVSDRGYWLRAAFNDATGTLSAPVMGRLLGEDGTPLLENDRRDAEDLTLLPDGGVIVSFERDHRLWLYPPSDEPAGVPFTQPPVALSLPPDLSEISRNGGMEAVALLPDGRLAVLIEGRYGDDRAHGWLGTPERPWRDAAAGPQPVPMTWHAFSLPLEDGYRPTGASAGTDGLYVVERAFSIPFGFRSRLRRIPLSALEAPRPESSVPTDTLAAFTQPPVTDNFEGVDASLGADGVHLLLLSDDNYNGLQQTLLLGLTLPESPSDSRSRP